MVSRFRAIACLLSFSAVAFSQANGRVVGTVIDKSGGAIPNANVSLQLTGSETAAYSSVSGAEGSFVIPSVRPETYELVVQAPGFVRSVTQGVLVNAGRDITVPVTLEVQSVTETVEVTAAVQTVNTTTAEVSTTLSRGQILNLPTLNRSPLAFLGTQAGVTYNGKTNTTINGQRVSFSNVTVDGINVQDNFIRTNALDFLPNLLLLDQVAEVTVTTSNANPALGGGSSQVVFVTPSGTNQFHGNAYWSNRNNAFAANDWFNNRDGIKLPFLNQNQVGGSLGGPIVREKLFFYANFEAFRLRQQSSTNRTILTSDARNGIFTYRDTAGNIRKANVLQLAGVQADPTVASILAEVPTPDKINNYRLGDSSEAFIRNTGGYSFVTRNNRTRNNATGKIDYNFSTRNTFTGTFMWNSDLVDRPDYGNNYSTVPNVKNDNTTKFLSLGWRLNPTPSLTNELRWGFNYAPGLFISDVEYGNSIIDGFIFSNPLNTALRNQGRYTNTYNLSDNASWVRGNHTVQFGVQTQMIRVESFDEAGITPTYTIGIGSGNQGLVASQLPGINSTDLAAANNLLASLAGYVTSYTQTFNVTSRTSGFVAGAPNTRNFNFDTYGFYVQDAWKMNRRLTTTLGLRYDYFTVVKEQNGLYLLPQMTNGNPIVALLSPNTVLDFPSGGLYAPDRNNFAPNAGLAWDVFGNGKTSVRAGYSLSYVNDNHIRAIDNNTATNAGLSAASTRAGLSGTVAGGLTPVNTPTFKVPRTFADNYALSSTAAFGMPDPNLRTPYVQQWSFGIQQSIKNTTVEARYVGNHGTKLFRAFDFNQVDINPGGFLDDFKRAQQNGFLAQAAGLGFNPAYNANLSGSQPLTVFPRLASGGLLTNATVRSLIQQGAVGELANVYQTNGLNGALNFYRNPNALGTNFLTNYSNSSYNSLQIDVQRRFSRTFQYGANYTYARIFSDTQGNQQTNFEPFLDINNGEIERNRTGFDLTHALKINAYYELPMGPGHRFNVRGLGRVLGGWNIAGYYFIQSGSPFSVLSQRGTLNRAGRSTYNTAHTTLSGDALQDIFQVRMTPVGPYYAAAGAIGPDGRAVAGDGLAPFSGQVFYQPGPGTIGSLQRNYFTGPSIWNMDFKISKMTQITERQSLELRLDAANVFNHQGWYIGDQLLTSTNFGRITSTFFSPRRLQLSLYYRF